MLKCNEVVRLASDYLDKDLGWKDSLSVKIHIIICKKCRRFIRHLSTTIKIVQNMKRELTKSAEVEHIVKRVSDLE